MNEANAWIFEVLLDLQDFSKRNRLKDLDRALGEIILRFDALTEECSLTSQGERPPSDRRFNI